MDSWYPIRPSWLHDSQKGDRGCGQGSTLRHVKETARFFEVFLMLQLLSALRLRLSTIGCWAEHLATAAHSVDKGQRDQRDKWGRWDHNKNNNNEEEEEEVMELCLWENCWRHGRTSGPQLKTRRHLTPTAACRTRLRWPPPQETLHSVLGKQIRKVNSKIHGKFVKRLGVQTKPKSKEAAELGGYLRIKLTNIWNLYHSKDILILHLCALEESKSPAKLLFRFAAAATLKSVPVLSQHQQFSRLWPLLPTADDTRLGKIRLAPGT